MHNGAVVEIGLKGSNSLVDYQPFYEGVITGIRNLLVFDKTNPAYLVNKLWRTGPESIEPYSAAIKERVAVHGNVYKGVMRRTSYEAKKIGDANRLMCDLCIVDEQSRDLFLGLFEYALCEFVSDCEKRNLPLGPSSIVAVVEGFKQFFDKRPIYMSINVIMGADAVKVGAPKEGYSESDSSGSCMRFHSVFFRFKREIPQKREINTTMLLLFLSSLIDFFSVLVVTKGSIFKRGGAKVSYEGLRLTECDAPTGSAYASEYKKAKMLYIANEFLASDAGVRWDVDLSDVEFVAEEELAYLPKRTVGSSITEWKKYHTTSSADDSCHERKGSGAGEVSSDVCETRASTSSSERVICAEVGSRAGTLTDVIVCAGNTGACLAGKNSTSSGAHSVIRESASLVSANSSLEFVPSLLKESAAVESGANVAASM
ncbi:hypothetical protein [Neorickettsia findlayensis]|uniref:Uncharacterized protein n=1 Tax=Neorickettsia findlayensis TaxID=2686014 RepID=A0A6P1GBU3_9RICK|nr:hypothetical protein [Neorickettsia findlayensis]QHD65291.1 hypothetical protein GP480_02415 [Neorickettsia findlayensis]